VVVYANFPEEKAIIAKQDTLNTMVRKTTSGVVNDSPDKKNKKKN
jgi:hypothetical protein